MGDIMDDYERECLVKDYKTNDYKNYLYEYDDVDTFLYECFLMHNIALKLEDDRREERLSSLDEIAIDRLNKLPNNELNRFIDNLTNDQSTYEDLAKDWAFKAKSLKKIEKFVNDNEIIDEKYIDELKNNTANYPFDANIETKILSHIDTDYPSLYESDLSKNRFYKNNKMLRRSLAVLSVLCDTYFALCKEDIEDYKSEKSNISEDFKNLMNNNIEEVSYVICRSGQRLPNEVKM